MKKMAHYLSAIILMVCGYAVTVIASTNMKSHLFNIRILLIIVTETHDLFHLLAMKFFRPMTFLTGILGRPQMLNRISLFFLQAVNPT